MEEETGLKGARRDVCVLWWGERGRRGVQWERDLNKILLLSSVGPPGGLLEGGDDRGTRMGRCG